MPEELKFLTEYGVAALLAGIIFYFYRQSHQACEKRLTELVKDRAEDQKVLLQVIREHTAVSEKGVAANENLSRSIDRAEVERMRQFEAILSGLRMNK